MDHEGLLDHLDMLHRTFHRSRYAKFLPIVQSSGTGKSRMVDELGKFVYLIPLNLRPSGDKGWFCA